MIYSSVLSLCRSPHLAEDITSEFFPEAQKGCSYLQGRHGAQEMAACFSQKSCAGYYPQAKQRVPSTSSADDDDSSTLSDVADTADTEENVSSDMAVQQMLDALSADQREIVHLKIYCELTFAEISDVLQIPHRYRCLAVSVGSEKLRKLYGEVL